MITVNVRELLNPNVDEVELDIGGSKVECKELLDRVKTLLNLGDENYALKHNEVFLHPIEMIDDGSTLVLFIEGEQEEQVAGGE